MVKESKQRIECFHCKRLFPLETMISGEPHSSSGRRAHPETAA